MITTKGQRGAWGPLAYLPHTFLVTLINSIGFIIIIIISAIISIIITTYSYAIILSIDC